MQLGLSYQGMRHWLLCVQVIHDANGGTSVSDLTLVDVNTPEVSRADCVEQQGRQTHRHRVQHNWTCCFWENDVD
jgi:hypothetical protein